MSWFTRISRPEPRLAPLGIAVQCFQYEVSVASVEPYVYVGPNPPPEGTELWAALVELTNLHTEAVHYAPHKWHLYDREHFSHATVVTHYCRQPALANTYLAPGARTRGYITFQVPQGTVPARISFVADSRGVADFEVLV
jgi:hypothetical protein